MSLSKEQHAAHLAAGLCVQCDGGRCTKRTPQPAKFGRLSCPDCLDRRLRLTTKKRGMLKRQKRCACGAPRRLWLRTCAACAEVESIKKRVATDDCIARGVCVRCRTNPAREREPRLRPPRKKRDGHPAGMNAASYDRPRFLDCDACALKRLEQQEARAASAGCQSDGGTRAHAVVHAASRSFRHGKRAA
jgi:hypothetical protein